MLDSQSDNDIKYAVEANGLTKTYKPSNGATANTALNHVNLKIPRGSIFGLLGPNGAGKSTLINILAGLVIKSKGTVKIWGHDIESEMRLARRAIGVVPQELNVDPFFTPYEALDLHAGLYGVPKRARRTQEILKAIGLEEQRDAYARTMSGGMRRRLLIGKALVHSPRVLVLDEPTAGVDVELRRQLWEYVRELNQDGTTILLTTHYLEEAEVLCDEIAIINDGNVVACEAKHKLLGLIDVKEMRVAVDRDLKEVPPSLSSYNVKLNGSRELVFSYAPSKINSGEILTDLRKTEFKIQDLSTREVDLEDIFLSLTHNS